MKKVLICLILLPLNSVWARPDGAPICEVEADFGNITAMFSRTRNQNPGSYTITAPDEYTPGNALDIVVEGPAFTGIMFTVVDANGNSVGTFAPPVATRSCEKGSMAVTHSGGAFGSVTTKTLPWTPPAPNTGPVYVEGYVLSGSRGDSGSQQFYRFVTDDGSAKLILEAGDLIFRNTFE